MSLRASCHISHLLMSPLIVTLFQLQFPSKHFFLLESLKIRIKFIAVIYSSFIPPRSPVSTRPPHFWGLIYVTHIRLQTYRLSIPHLSSIHFSSLFLLAYSHLLCYLPLLSTYFPILLIYFHSHPSYSYPCQKYSHLHFCLSYFFVQYMNSPLLPRTHALPTKRGNSF